MTQEFSCCGFYTECKYGRMECYFAETEPDKKAFCRCYQIKHTKYNIKPIEAKKEDVVPIPTFEEDTEGQLSLF